MPSAPQAGQRALSLSASGIMTSNTFIKGTGILQVLPLGLLLLSLLVSGSHATEAPTTAATDTSSQITTSTNSEVSATSATTLSTGMTTISTATSATTLSTGMTTISTATSATTLSTGMTTSSTATSAIMSPTTTTHSSSHLSVTGGMTLNGTTMSNDTSKNMIYCPSFNCNYSDCYSMYTSQNTTPCAANDFCQLLRRTDMWYSASCSKYCGDRCMNVSQTNCTVNCCNSTGCLNYTFASMMMITTTVFRTTTTATPAPTTTTTTQTTTANKGNRCHNGTCTGTSCYTNFNSVFQFCSSSQPHCQLKNESTDSTIKWTAGCTNW
ncbi:putative GPI-anchored protein pfl2 [Archocentrus centrarchus]|uniref:putative GPI-anchored protein pfl2 n=1 Tax=Archocentrus centrarchus TaxID=63155 RepID=UPI0011EA0032|nr:putative GPI-anchored protein pfl2 [Archocentrus centrarchus]